MSFKQGIIIGVTVSPLTTHHDQRGWLCELFRNDEVPNHCQPVMAYMSLTNPDVVRGPHEHVDQSDYFCFIGPSEFKLYLWDNRPDSPTYRVKQVLVVGTTNPCSVIVPPGVVHAYQNVGKEHGLVFNAANRLYKGEKKLNPVDEIRHEHDVHTPFTLSDD